MRMAVMVSALLLAGAAAAEPPGFDPRAHRNFTGRASEILVLGTPHLAGLPASFTPESLTLVRDRLAAWKPDIITIESVSGPECEMLGRYRAHYGTAFDDYCWDTSPAEKATGLSIVAATAEIDRLLAIWPASPTAGQRRHLAAVFMAGGDRASALVQWLRLPVVERRAGDGLEVGLVALLRKVETSPNENYTLGASLAAWLGLERVYLVDDHSADSIQAGMGPDYDAAIQKIWSAAAPRLAAIKTEETKLGTAQATLEHYLYYNRRQAVADAFTYDFGAALADGAPELPGRRYVGWWETRNLRMVANIRAALAPRPGSRLLAIVGSAHKGYFEAYLDMMHDVRLVDAETVLE